jgi:hypothetical protein
MNAPVKLAAALAAVTIALAGCGGSGSSSVSPAAYVSSVCKAATNWKNSIQMAGTKLSSGINTKSLALAKAEYVAFVGALVSATTNAESQLKAAGSPSVSNGKQIAGTLVRIFTGAKGSLANAEAQAAALPISSPRAFETAATQVVSGIRGSLAAMSSVSPEHNAQLRDAATKDPTCRTLAGGA